MYRTLCVLTLLTLQAGLAHCFSWDIVAATKSRLEFYNEGKVTYSVPFTDVDVDWLSYDPFHNRVLFTNSSRTLLSFDMATGKIQTLIDLKPVPDLYLINDSRFTYDPITGLLFFVCRSKVYSYLVKPGYNHEVNGDLGQSCHSIAVDSCGGYIYWISDNNKIERVRLNGSEREEVIESSDKRRYSLTIDPQTQNIYWTEFTFAYRHSTQDFILSADLNGKHRRTLNHGHAYGPMQLTLSNDFIYWTESHYKFFWKIPQNLPLGTDVEPKGFNETSIASGFYKYIAANYAIEAPQGNPRCNALKRLLPDYSETNDSDSINVSTGGSLLRVNETTVSGESRVSGDTCDISVCHNYCLQGNCSVSADGQPKCRCNVGYVGVRCEVNACQNYCLHGGVCSLSEQNNPVCQCTRDYQGERCDVPAFLIKCSQAVSLLKDILNADLTSVTEGKGVKSTCASTVV